MSIASGLIALALLGAGGPVAPDTPPLVSQVQILEMRGLDWRNQTGEARQRIARQGPATIWIAGREVVPGLVQSSTVVATIGSPAPEVSHHISRAYVAELKRIADGPVNEATRVAFQPELDAVQDGFEARLTGRTLDQGVLATVVLDESRLVALHTSASTETLRGESDTPGEDQKITSQIQVPEVHTCHVEGEWLIPHGDVLLVSLGVHSVTDSKGHSEPRERLAVIEMKPMRPVSASGKIGPKDLQEIVEESQMVARAARLPLGFPNLSDPALTPSNPVPAAPDETTPISLSSSTPTPLARTEEVVRPMPHVPSRTIPQAIDSNGQLVTLPPLPEELEEPEPSDESAEPRPTPQTRKRQAEPTVTPESDDLAGVPESGPDSRLDADREFADKTANTIAQTLREVGIDLLGAPCADDSRKTLSFPIQPGMNVTEIRYTPGPSPRLQVFGKPSGEPRNLCILDAEVTTTSVNLPSKDGEEGWRQGATDKHNKDKAKADDASRSACPKTPSDCCETSKSDTTAKAAADKSFPFCPEKTALAAKGRDTWRLSLHAAISLGLSNAKTVRIASRDIPTKRTGEIHASEPTLFIQQLDVRTSIYRAKAEVMAHVRSIVQTYWNLAAAYTRLGAAESAVKLGEEILECERGKGGHVRFGQTICTEDEERVERFRLGLVTATSDVIVTERQLRNLLGLPPTDNRRIIPVTEPSVAPLRPDWTIAVAEMVRAQPDVVQSRAMVRLAELQLLVARNQLLPVLDEEELKLYDGLKEELGCFARPAEVRMIIDGLQTLAGVQQKFEALATVQNLLAWQFGGAVHLPLSFRGSMSNARQAQYSLIRQKAVAQQTVHQATHQLARFFLEVDANYQQFQTAGRLKAAAIQRLKSQRASYEKGTTTLDQYLDTVDRWANAVAVEADFQSRYNTAIVGAGGVEGDAPGKRTHRPDERDGRALDPGEAERG